jgi:hypothetical protein
MVKKKRLIVKTLIPCAGGELCPSGELEMGLLSLS